MSRSRPSLLLGCDMGVYAENDLQRAPKSFGGLVGCEWAVDAFDCDPARLRDMATLRSLCDEMVDTLGLNVVQPPAWHHFPGHAGVTGLYLLSESHLACHTYPEFALATFNLYCCRRLPPWPWNEVLARQLAAGRVQVVELARGDAKGDTGGLLG